MKFPKPRELKNNDYPDLQEILKRDTEIEQDRLKGCLDLIKKDHPDVDIENFKDWEEIGYYKQTVPVRLCSLELQDDPEENSLILSKEDAEKSHFGTILPFVSGKPFRPSIMKHSSLVGSFIIYEEKPLS